MKIVRIIDFLLALFFLILFSPLIIILILLIYFSSFSNPFFLQTRTGKNLKKFKIIKFKTMKEKNNDISDLDRVTFIGGILRKTSLDELPELFNILKGDMTFIGPRPLLPEYDSYYNNNQLMRFRVLPGITGLAQVNGRNNLSWEEKFDYDTNYVLNKNVKLDFIILIKTIKIIFNFKIVNANNINSMERFDYEQKNKK